MFRLSWLPDWCLISDTINLSQSYSMWPVILTTYNLPPWLCMKESSFMLTLLIPGPKSPGKDIDVYLRPLIDDLKDLWAKPGVETIDVANKAFKFNMRRWFYGPSMIFLLEVVCLGGVGKVTGHALHVMKTLHLRSLEFNGETKNKDPPREFNRDAIMTQLARLPTRVKGKHPRFGGVKIKRNVLVELNWTKRSIFYELEYWSFLTLKHNLDVMHIEKNVLESILNTLLMNDKSKDTAKARQDLKSLVIRKVCPTPPRLWLAENKNGSGTKLRLRILSKPKTEKRFIRQRHVDNDPGVSESSELFALACGPSQTPISVNSCVVNGVRRPLGWKVVEHVSHKKFSIGGVIVVEDDPDVIHVDNSSDLALSTSLNDLEIAALHIDGQSIDVDAPPDIIDVVDEDDDIIDEEDPIPHDLADSDDEDLVNLDIDDGVNVMSADVARGHGGDGGGDDRPPSHHIPTGCGGCLGNRGKGTRKPNLGGRRAGRQHTRQETRNLGLKAITDKSGPVSIRFEFGDRETLMPLGEHAAHWANYLGELVRELPLHYPSWRQVPAEQKAGVMARIGTQFDMRPHMESDRWPLIYAAIQQHLQKIYNGKKAALKERHWIPDSDGTYDLERIRLSRPSHISEVNWDAQIGFWNDPKNRARAAQNKQNRAKSKVVCRQGSRSIAALRDMHMESSATREYPSLIHTFFLTHTVNGVFLNPEDKALYDEMLRLQGLGSNTETGVPYTEDEIMAIVRGGKQRGHIPGVGRVLPRQGTVIPPPPPCTHSSDVVKLKKREKVLTRQVNMFMRLFRSGDKFSQMLTQLESQPEIGDGSGTGGPGDDEQGHDEDDDEDGEDDDDS
ncbi:retrotransposon gag domain, retroviral aspartyl protease [Tanacetum coccineum]|uniref:Retrotransposon gag domain, retroviral aspartyl protease n=1 Tax=Tanacetum coccineum TaxID=301880 RepID=A0ABQ4ZR51_9ASTR